jgi:hypothetical protein
MLRRMRLQFCWIRNLDLGCKGVYLRQAKCKVLINLVYLLQYEMKILVTRLHRGDDEVCLGQKDTCLACVGFFSSMMN